MLNKMTSVTGSAGTMSWASALASAGRVAKFGPQAAAVHRQVRAPHAIKAARIRPGNLRLALARGLLAALAAPLVPMHGALAQQAPSAEVVREFDLPAGELAAALDVFRAQSGIELVYAPGLVAGRQARAVSGRLGWPDARHRLLQGSGLGYRDAHGRIELVVAEPEERGATGGRAASAQPEAVAPQAVMPATTELSKITVTGTRIRGGTTPSPVIAIGSERIREEGFADLGEVIRSVPQNFSGGQNPGVLMGNVIGGGGANQNVTGGSSLNLRGLGPDASLTLLNGHRMAYSGFVQAVDISAIPVEAVERLEIVADGASAIYGSDAVGGVANVILKRGFDGVSLGARYGAATDGGLGTREYTATAGAVWSGGGLLATYKDASTDPVYARQRNYTAYLREPQMLLPEVESRSGLVSAYQALGDAVELRLDALRTRRRQRFDYWVSDPNAYNALAPETTTSFVAPGVEFLLPNDWMLSIAGTWGKDEWMEDHSRVNPATGEVVPQVSGCYCNESRAYEVGAEGPLFEASGGDARLAIGAGYRRNAIHLPAYISGGANAGGGEEASRFAYAELHVPVLEPGPDGGGAQRLELTAAVRGEDYDSFGRVTTPKLGVLYGPGADVTLKASWGKSFKAPTLFQSFRLPGLLLVSPASLGGTGYPADAAVLYAFGGNPNLEPERAEVWSASVAFHPEAMPGLEAEITWFDVDYVDRVVEPITAFDQALSNPAFAEFVEPYPTVEEQAALVAGIPQFINATGAPYDPNKVVAFVESRYINAVRQRVRGVDLAGSYRFDVGAGELTVRGAASWLDSAQRSAGTTFDLAGTLHNPAKVSGRLGAVWSQGGFAASLFGNYRSGVRNVVADEKGASFTTFDATLRYAIGDGAGAWSGLELALSAENLFDRAPPLYTVPAGNRSFVPAYDSTNYSPIGRFVSFSASKRW